MCQFLSEVVPAFFLVQMICKSCFKCRCKYLIFTYIWLILLNKHALLLLPEIFFYITWARRKQVFFHTLLGRRDTYASAVTVLMIHFIPKVNTISECHWLYSMHEFVIKLQVNIICLSIFHFMKNLVITQMNYLEY